MTERLRADYLKPELHADSHPKPDFAPFLAKVNFRQRPAPDTLVTRRDSFEECCICWLLDCYMTGCTGC